MQRHVYARRRAARHQVSRTACSWLHALLTIGHNAIHSGGTSGEVYVLPRRVVLKGHPVLAVKQQARARVCGCVCYQNSLTRMRVTTAHRQPRPDSRKALPRVPHPVAAELLAQ